MSAACRGLLDRVRLLGPHVVAGREEAERRCALSDAVVGGMRQAGVFRMTAPRARGGLEADPLTQLAVIEELAAQDASAGWVAMIGSDGGYYSAFLDPAVAAEVHADVDAVTAGFVNPAGTASRVPGGYRLSGRWPFGSGSRHAAWFASGFCVVDETATRTGRSEWRVAMLPAAEVEVLPTWDALGLRATGSNDYAVREVVVPRERTFSFSDRPRLDGPLYRFPAMFLVNIGAVPLGTARAALAELVDVAGRKRRPQSGLLRDDVHVQNAVATAEAEISSSRCYLVDAVGALWDVLLAGDAPSREVRARVWTATAHSFSASRRAVERAADAAGSTSIHAASPLQRALRDVVTMSQHAMAQPRLVDACGRLLLGLDAELPLL